MALIINIIIVLIIAGFLFWSVKLIIGLIPMDAWFKQIIEVLLTIMIVAVVIFYVLIPLLRQLPSLGHF